MPKKSPINDVIIFCGGRGTRMSEKTREMPKPLIELGEFPILWHIMKNYSHFNAKHFILTLGYKGDMIIDYFLHRHPLMQDFSVVLDNIQIPKNKEDWELSFIQTGTNTLTAKRLLQCRDSVREFPFMATYGDGVADMDIRALIERHTDLKKKHGVIATITITRPFSKYGILKLGGDLVESFREKPQMDEFVNVGYMVLEREVFDYINPDEDVMFEETLADIAADGKLGYYIHEGFWHPMDTYKDYVDLNKMWRESPKWKIWTE
ncbi:MAG: sugar phosphate nucleotidyltransferase [Erysipelotrichaceae bacterium]|nr:sugar phosphate nucleotidyltransferase [Erysipelotrichaceae bacterium]